MNCSRGSASPPPKRLWGAAIPPRQHGVFCVHRHPFDPRVRRRQRRSIPQPDQRREPHNRNEACTDHATKRCRRSRGWRSEFARTIVNLGDRHDHRRRRRTKSILRLRSGNR
jgi:hypothetical protein